MTNKTKTQSTAAAAEPVKLTGRAADLWQSVQARWELSEPAIELLRCACEAMQRAAEAATEVSAEGATYRDRWGQPRVHPAAKLEIDHRAQAARHLQSLGVTLED